MVRLKNEAWVPVPGTAKATTNKNTPIFLEDELEMKNDLQNQNAVAKALEAEDWSCYLGLHDKPFRLDAFRTIATVVSDQDYWGLLGEVYIETEYIWRQMRAWKRYLSSNRPGSEFFMEDEADREMFCALPEMITVYRGYIDELNRDGLSYSLSKEKAAWFAERFPQQGAKVRERIIKKSHCLAYTNIRNEQEIIIRPAFIAE